MAKRIVSGIFILTALGALGVILAGAMTSGEQLIVRFLTAVTVAALALYVISDLRLHSEQVEPANGYRDDESEEPIIADDAAVPGAAGELQRISRSVRRSQKAPPQPSPRFEAIEPVTSSASRVGSASDPTTSLEGSRLLAPAHTASDRALPPHSAPVDISPSRPPRSQPSDSPLTTGSPEPGAAIDPTAGQRATGSDLSAKGELVDNPGSPITTTSFNYLGQLDANGVDWPPKPPVPVSPDVVQTARRPTDDPAPMDAPTAELPVLGPPSTASARGDASITSPAPSTLPTDGRSHSDRLTAAIRSGEYQVIQSLISQGMLSTAGPITDRDVRTMVYVAFTSNELRKIILAGGTPDGIRAGDLDLGEVELFDESRFAPAPKLLYAGLPSQPPGTDDAVLDLVALEEEAGRQSVPPGAGDGIGDVELVPALPAPSNLYRRSENEQRVEQ